ncbi:ATP-grasp domain-containing protein [Abiotrophia defectiva]|uniref:ATP-grasp domain protein n=1 Tax=Abiotrophia defectiva ATCC 49176 TaxID=592010 RepID=W1Q4F4_ABIDE|nr:ATP-grasp domain-containing protein [Abiotrophia defectiva]ESK66115.1 ATP-grasp domain protein [Abiotrophia defectiva ATCC 49176]QKH46397.1 ATP-grasp domain-containing protein [Abiotrophia defectiva]
MPEKHYPGATVGIIGSSVHAALLAQAAGKLGYRVASLVLNPENLVRQFATWQTVAEAYDEATLRFFAGRIDTVIVEPGLLSNLAFKVLADITDVSLSEDLRAIATDRLIEKAYLDEKRCLVAPFAMVTSLEDVKEAVEFIGFPCYLKYTQRHIEAVSNHLILYSEADYEAAQAKIALGTCILEAWIPSEKVVSLSVVRNERGELLVYPPFEQVQSSAVSGTQVRYPVKLHEEVEREIRRLGRYLVETLALVGCMTIDFLVTSAGVVYINSVEIGAKDAAMFTLGAMSLSCYEAMVRSVVGLPLPSLVPLADAAISLPLEALNAEQVMTQYMLRTDWGFALFNPMGRNPLDLEGQVIVTGESLAHCQRQIELTDILKK